MAKHLNYAKANKDNQYGRYLNRELRFFGARQTIKHKVFCSECGDVANRIELGKRLCSNC